VFQDAIGNSGIEWYCGSVQKEGATDNSGRRVNRVEGNKGVMKELTENKDNRKK